MKKKKLIMIIVAILVVILGTLLFIVYINSKNTKRYTEIKENVASESERFLNLSLPPEYNEGREEYLYEDDIVDLQARGADKNILLDIDKKTYCKTVIMGKCSNKEWKVKVYLSCKKYKDKEYDKIRNKVKHHR